jgi:hypothetical protein
MTATIVTVQMLAPAPFAAVTAFSGNAYVANSVGIANVQAGDVNSLENAGWVYAIQRHGIRNTAGAPVAASASVTVSSVTLTPGGFSLTIAAQPDSPRQIQAVLNAGGGTMTAGSLIWTYVANDGTTTTDTFSFIGATGANTYASSKGVEVLQTATVTPSTGGTTPGIMVGTNGYLAVPLDPGFVSWALTKAMRITPTNGSLGLSVPADETVSTTLTLSTGLYTPATTVDGTHQYSAGYSYVMPASAFGTVPVPPQVLL